MASRFLEADGTLIEELKHGSENKNTKRSTVNWTGVFKQWAVTRGKKEEIDSYEVSQLYEALAQFFAEPRKENDKEYEPDSLKFTQASLDRYLRSKKISKICRKRCKVPVVKKSFRRKGKKASRAWNEQTAEQSPEPYERGRGNIMGERAVGRRNSPVNHKHYLVAAYDALWTTRPTRAP